MQNRIDKANARYLAMKKEVKLVKIMVIIGIVFYVAFVATMLMKVAMKYNLV